MSLRDRRCWNKNGDIEACGQCRSDPRPARRHVKLFRMPPRAHPFHHRTPGRVCALGRAQAARAAGRVHLYGRSPADHRGGPDDDALGGPASGRPGGGRSGRDPRLLPWRSGADRRGAGGSRWSAGPHDLRRLGEFFGRAAEAPADYGAYDIEILAEINHAPRLIAGRRFWIEGRRSWSARPPAPTSSTWAAIREMPGRASGRPCGHSSPKGIAFRSTA